MTIGRIVLCVLILVGGGFALGWLAFPPSHGPDDKPAPTTDEKPRDLQQRFALLPADVSLDREKPSLAVSGDNVLLAWASQTGEDEYTLYLARSADRGAKFSDPIPFRKMPLQRYEAIMRGQKRTMTTNVMPRLSAAAERITLGWTEPGTNGGPLRFLVAHSRDSGATFSDPICLHGAAAKRPNFTALLAGSDGTTTGVWLDNRNHFQQPFRGLLDGNTDVAKPEALVYSGPDGKGVCPCCDLDVARTSAGALLVAFRNNVEGYRDIYLARSRDGTSYEMPVAVSPDHWAFDGCPHDGPSLALSGDRVHVAWMSGHTGKHRVYLADAALDDLVFTPRPVSGTSAGEQGHPRIVCAPGGAFHVVWDEGLSLEPTADPKQHHHGTPPRGSGRTIVYTSSKDGVTFATPRQLIAKTGVFQMHPALSVDAAGGVHVAWSELTEQGKSVVYLRPALSAARPVEGQ